MLFTHRALNSRSAKSTTHRSNFVCLRVIFVKARSTYNILIHIFSYKFKCFFKLCTMGTSRNSCFDIVVRNLNRFTVYVDSIKICASTIKFLLLLKLFIVFCKLFINFGDFLIYAPIFNKFLAFWSLVIFKAL